MSSSVTFPGSQPMCTWVGLGKGSLPPPIFLSFGWFGLGARAPPVVQPAGDMLEDWESWRGLCEL
jgi:hypothetical protein